MASKEDSTVPGTEDSSTSRRSNTFSEPRNSSSSISTTSLIFEHLAGHSSLRDKEEKSYREEEDAPLNEDFDQLHVEEGPFRPQLGTDVDPKYKRWLYLAGLLCFIGWVLALVFFILTGSYKHRSALAHDPDAVSSVGSGKKITIEQLQQGFWYPRSQSVSWISSPSGEDGLVLQKGGANAYLSVEDVKNWEYDYSQAAAETTVLMPQQAFKTDLGVIWADDAWPSPDLKTVLVISNKKKNWRHSYTGEYWLVDVEKGTGEPLDPTQPHGRIQLATWAPSSDAVVFTRDNDMFLRPLSNGVTAPEIVQVTTDGGAEMFNGVPDWVYEEEVFEGNSVTWWSDDGKYIAFLATNESGVPDYPVEYFVSRPSLTQPDPGLENYPETRQIKYPKAGAPNPVVRLRLYDLEAKALIRVPIDDDFPDDDRLITEVIWAGSHVLVRETNRESYILKMVLIDVANRTGRIVRTQDVNALDGGWFEVSETTTFIPKNVSAGRADDGYIDTVIHDGYDHIGYFTPLDNPEPRLLTSGHWEVVRAPSAVDLINSLIYFTATKEGSTQRHIYSVGLSGNDRPNPLTDTSKDGYYDATFSKNGGYALLSYKGPDVPWQRIVSTPSNPSSFSHSLEENAELARRAAEHEVPLKVFSTIEIDGYKLNAVERRPAHFDASKQYPVVFHVYGGPGSQTVDKRFSIDFQSYIASSLGYIVVTVDGRGTGFIGRAARVVVRGKLGYWESRDQISAAKMWAKKSYVDGSRMAIWGWSYGGFMTLKTLEVDAGQTFKYGMAVAPVTNFLYYDSIYTERYMLTPLHNPNYTSLTCIRNVTAISQASRFLLMHGIADDNVHLQNSLTLLDALDLAGVENYDVHVFPDSDHSIYFHNANRMVYDRLGWWITNAMNGEWERLRRVVPLREGVLVGERDQRRGQGLSKGKRRRRG